MNRDLAIEILMNAKDELEEAAESIISIHDIIKMKNSYDDQLNRKIARRHTLAAYYKIQMILISLDYLKSKEEKPQPQTTTTTIWR